MASEGNCGEIRRDDDAILHKVSAPPSLSLVALCSSRRLALMVGPKPGSSTPDFLTGRAEFTSARGNMMQILDLGLVQP